ncbi:MAG: hypothetical protein ACE15F_09695 [bacterium]
MKNRKDRDHALIPLLIIPLIVSVGLSFALPAQAEESPAAVPAGSAIVTDDLASSADLSGSGDIDLPNARALVVRWNFGALTAKDYHVYVLDDQVGKLEYLGRTGDGVTTYLLWEENAKNLAPAYRKGPQSGHSYLFYIFALSGNAAKPLLGSLATSGPVLFKTADSSGGETPPEIPANQVVVTDDIDSYVDLSNGQDTDSKNNRELVVRWNFGDVKAKDFHIYVAEGTLASIQFLGRTGNGTANFFRWRESSHFLAKIFNPGPQPGHSYRFFVFALTSNPKKPAAGPIFNAGPVEFLVSEDPTPTPGGIKPNSVIVTDDLGSFDDLSNGTDTDPITERQLVVKWNFPDVKAKDFHVYVLANNQGKAKYLGRSGGGDVNHFDWRQGGTRFMVNEFKNGPQPNTSYRFYVFIFNQSGPKAVSGPFATAGPVFFQVEETAVTPTPTPEPPVEMVCVKPSDHYQKEVIGLSPVILGDIEIKGAQVDTNLGNKETILLDVINWAGDENLDVLVPWSEDGASEKAHIQFKDGFCGGRGPKVAVVTMSSPQSATFTALDENGKKLDTKVSGKKDLTPASVSIRLTDNVTPVENITLISKAGEKGIRKIEIKGSDVGILRICWGCEGKEPEPTVTPTPTPTQTPTPVPTISVTVTDTGQEKDLTDLSNKTDKDPNERRELAVRWFLNELQVKDFHIYVMVDQQGKPQYLGRAGSDDANLFVWNNQNRMVAGPFKQGPQFGHSYQFFIYVLKSKGPKAFIGPYTHAGPVKFEEENNSTNNGGNGGDQQNGDDDGEDDSDDNQDSNNPEDNGPIEAAVDIKPGACPNYLSPSDKGNLVVAIMGTDTFDVAKIDPESVILADVAPVSWKIEDVGAPNDPNLQVTGCEACNKKEPDGNDDLVFIFDAAKILKALGNVKKSDCVKLELHGKLAGGNGAEIQGVDYVSISNKGTVVVGKK